MTEETLENRCFRLGFTLMDLPPEPAPLNREYYNLGLKIQKIYGRLIDFHTEVSEICNPNASPKLKEVLKRDLKNLQNRMNQKWKEYQKIRKQYPSLNEISLLNDLYQDAQQKIKSYRESK